VVVTNICQHVPARLSANDFLRYSAPATTTGAKLTQSGVQ